MSSWMYVSRQTFKLGMTAVTSGMEQISSALVRFRKECGERFDALSSRVDEGVEIAKQTQKEVGDIHEAGNRGHWGDERGEYAIPFPPSWEKKNLFFLTNSFSCNFGLAPHRDLSGYSRG